MIVQHPMLWCAVLLMAGIAVGLSFPLPYYLPLLMAAVVVCTLTRKTKHLYDVLTLIVWFLLGCSRASLASYPSTTPAWQQAVGKEKTAELCLAQEEKMLKELGALRKAQTSLLKRRRKSLKKRRRPIPIRRKWSRKMNRELPRWKSIRMTSTVSSISSAKAILTSSSSEMEKAASDDGKTGP